MIGPGAAEAVPALILELDHDWRYLDEIRSSSHNTSDSQLLPLIRFSISLKYPTQVIINSAAYTKQ